MANFHSKQFNYLKTALKSGNLHHSYIFHGPEGAGKFDFSIFFAKYIQCKERGDEPCGGCKNCKINKNGFIVDSHIIDLGKDVNIKIAEINKIKDFVGHSSVAGNFKIVIVNNAQNMTRDSRDVLLKTLEEPPENSLILLISDEISKLPKTVLSRCPALFFPRLKWDRDIISKNNQDLFEISQIINFGKKDALDQIQNASRDLILEDYRSIESDLLVLLGGEYYPKMILAKEVSDSEEMKKRLESFIAVLYNILLYKQGICDWDKNTKNILGSLEKNLECDRILELLEKALRLLNLLETNVSKRIIFEDFVLNI